MTTEEDFLKIAQEAKSLPPQSNENLLKLYSLFKQAQSGDVAGKRPGIFDMRARAKYDAWKKLSGLSKDEARSQYVSLVQSLKI